MTGVKIQGHKTTGANPKQPEKAGDNG